MAKVGGYWQETYLISLAKKGGSDVEFAAKCEDVKFGGGARGITLKTLVNGGNLIQFNPQELWTVTMTIYPVVISEVDQLFYGDTSDVTQPLSVLNTLTRYEMRFVMVFTDDTTLTTAAGATAASKAGYRISATGGYITNAAIDPSGKELKCEVTVEFAPFTSAGVGVLKRESTDTTAVLPALGAYA